MMKLSEAEIEDKLVARIKEPRQSQKKFAKIAEGFEPLLTQFAPAKSCIGVEEYFGEGKGFATSKKRLLKEGIIDEKWLRTYATKHGNEKEDFKGLYILLHDKKPFYVGISKGVITRIQQHVKGRSHNTSTLAHKIGTLRYEIITGKEYAGKRKELDREEYIDTVKAFLKRQEVAMIQIENDDELALFEIYCSMRLGTILNSFETH